MCKKERQAYERRTGGVCSGNYPLENSNCYTRTSDLDPYKDGENMEVEFMNFEGLDKLFDIHYKAINTLIIAIATTISFLVNLIFFFYIN